jgi:hypothetical protein
MSSCIGRLERGRVLAGHGTERVGSVDFHGDGEFAVTTENNSAIVLYSSDYAS